MTDDGGCAGGKGGFADFAQGLNRFVAHDAGGVLEGVAVWLTDSPPPASALWTCVPMRSLNEMLTLPGLAAQATAFVPGHKLRLTVMVLPQALEVWALLDGVAVAQPSRPASRKPRLTFGT